MNRTLKTLKLEPIDPTWAETTARYLKGRVGRAPETIRREKTLLKWMAPLLDAALLSQVTTPVLAELRDIGLEQGWSIRSCNYATGLVSSIMREAMTWGWALHYPKLRKLPGEVHRCRYLSIDAAERLLAALPVWVRRMAEFTLETGLRKGTLCALTWQMVDFSTETLNVPANIMKCKNALSLPLSKRAVNQPNGKQWLRALAALGFEDFRWHDLRHTWASWHVQHGTPLAEIQRLGGWKTISMVMVYSHLETLQLRKSVRRFELLRLRA